MTDRARILLADRDKLMLDILRDLLKTKYEIVGEVEDGLALIRVAQELKPDIVVSDITMPPLTGLEAMSLIKKDLPEVKFVFLSNHADPGYLTEAMHLGASGYVLNKSGSSELLAAIEEVLEGRCHVA
jgi:DNA-binding NarL/FixJ family response regulator